MFDGVVRVETALSLAIECEVHLGKWPPIVVINFVPVLPCPTTVVLYVIH
jgi:hypothetical protein